MTKEVTSIVIYTSSTTYPTASHKRHNLKDFLLSHLTIRSTAGAAKFLDFRKMTVSTSPLTIFALLITLVVHTVIFTTRTTSISTIFVNAAAAAATRATVDDGSSSSIECGTYLAPSSIPFAGLGMYAGNRSLSRNEIVTYGDILIPIVERPWHIERRLSDQRNFLWNEYVCTVFKKIVDFVSLFFFK
jgi:hypothetical protein